MMHFKDILSTLNDNLPSADNVNAEEICNEQNVVK